VPISAVIVMSGVGASEAAAGFQGKPVSIVPRSHSVRIQAPASTTTSATRLSRPNRQASPAAIAG
jgi:hypothetical protein